MVDPHANCNFLVPIVNKDKLIYLINHSYGLINDIYRNTPLNIKSHINDDEHRYGRMLSLNN